MDATAFAQLPFSDAFNLWLSSRVRIAPGTRRDYQNDFHRLSPFLGHVRLREITIDHINRYRADRAQKAGPNRINKELNLLSQIMRRAGVWAPIADWYEPLPLPRSRGIALEPKEEAHLFRLAASRSRWIVAYCCSLIARNTCACPGELRALTLADFDTKNCTWIRITKGTKNNFRVRSLFCNQDAQWALRTLYVRALKKGAHLPQHYLLPHRGPDVHRPMYGWHKAWSALRAEAANKFPRLARLRFYDCRHTACTRMLENPEIPYGAIEAMMGHAINSQTKQLYFHIRNETLEKAARALSSGHYQKFGPGTSGRVVRVGAA